MPKVALNPAYDVMILGAGAAGLFCAGLLGQMGKRVLLLEGANRPGKKILMSGGGRCNFTNYDVGAEHYLSRNPHFCKSALAGYSQWDFMALVDSYAIDYYEKADGQLFCMHSAKDILQLLLDELAKGAVTLLTDCNIERVVWEATGSYTVHCSQGIFSAPRFVVATGGLSIPTMGASGLGYDIARQFGLSVLPRRAALVPFTLSDPWKSWAAALSGLSTEVLLSTESSQFRGQLLLTHRGLSGPAVLQSSSYWQLGEAISINWLPELDQDWLVSQKTAQAKSLLRTLISQYLPKKLVLALEQAHWSDLQDKPLAEIANADLARVNQALFDWQLKPSGTEGYRTAEVTLGGVDTADISSKTMECRQQPGLYFIGEVLDVTGHLGGYNFQWAWSSAYAAAQAISRI